MSKYEHIIFDLDHTLWDFDENCRVTLLELYDHYQLDKLQAFDELQFVAKYKEVNARLWTNHHRGLETKETIRTKRFAYTFEELGVDVKHIPAELDAQFIAICPTKGYLLPHAKELLEYLYPKYRLHILTNGFKESQATKMSHSGIDHYFEHVVLAEVFGHAKPDKRIFDHILELSGGNAQNSIMIGDDLEVDVIGAKNAGLDHVYLNRLNEAHDKEIQHEITSLKELYTIL